MGPISPDRLRDVLDPADWQEFERAIVQAREVLEGRVVWMVNSTAAGGGVAEMLRSFLAYTRGAGVNVRWMVMTGTPEFFRITKRIHNMVHGSAGDGGPLGEAERAVFEQVCEANAEHIASVVRPKDIVLLHDPADGGDGAADEGDGRAASYGGATSAPSSRASWSTPPGASSGPTCSRPTPASSRATRTSRNGRTRCEPRSSSRRSTCSRRRTRTSTPRRCGGSSPTWAWSVDHQADALPPAYTREDGTPGRVDRMCEVLSTGPPPSFGDPLVVQVSRWDRLKDHMGVMLGFAEHVVHPDAHLILAGPNVTSVADDPEGAEVLEEVAAAWRGLPHVAPRAGCTSRASRWPTSRRTPRS